MHPSQTERIPYIIREIASSRFQEQNVMPINYFNLPLKGIAIGSTFNIIPMKKRL
uniref:Uncharacterized protein n=2 Tax=Anguilla anguilla TaxID=7936 RepID=A0A0E9V466_ANGAN